MIPLDHANADALTRSFILGTARQPAPIACPELTALALLGHRARFRRYAPPPPQPRGAPVEDARLTVPPAARPLLRRLVGDGASADVAALALADACDRRQLRPHPFDLPRLSGFVRAHAEQLGASAVAWAARGRTEERPTQYFIAEALDEANWASARPAARVEFIAAMRARDPARARELVAASFTADAAPTRARLLGALAHGLSPADLPFLESLAKDRAPSVRSEAQRLLVRVPGGAAMEARLCDFSARTKRSVAGRLRKRAILALELPADLAAAQSDEAGRRWAAEEYAGLPLDAMADAFGLAVTDMIEAARDDAPLLALFARQATIERRFDLLATIVHEYAADAWIDALGAVADLPADAIAPWCNAALAPDLWPSLPRPAHLDQLYAALRRPLPPQQIGALLHAKAFAPVAGPPGPIEWLCVALAALTPAAQRSELRTALAAWPQDETARAILLLDCLDLLDPPTDRESS